MNLINSVKLQRKINIWAKRIWRNFGKKVKLTVVDSSKKNCESIEAIYIINLDRQKERWQKFKKEAESVKVKGNKSLLNFCRRISAIDAKNFQDIVVYEDRVKSEYNLNDQYGVDPDPRLLSIIKEKNIKVKLSKEETAVALSHIKAWSKLVEEKVPYALILEDDVFFEKSFSSGLNQAWNDLPNKREDGYKFDLLYLSFKEVEWGAEILNYSKYLNRPSRGLWWLSGYVLSYAGAKKLLDSLPIVGPVDLWINYQFPKIDVFTTKKSIIFQRNDLKSDNNYSILPVLSQVGIQSDKTHLLLEQKKGRNPLFVIGFNKSGNSVIIEALSLLGYRCCFERNREFSSNIHNIIANKAPLLFDAYVGIQSILDNYKTLEQFYQEAVFILTLDNEININDQEINDIVAYFKGKEEKLLILDWATFNNWELLCRFLSCKVPKHSFPFYKEDEATPKVDHLNSFKIPLSQIKLEVLEHDVHPWIVPYEKLTDFGVKVSDTGNRKGNFKSAVNEYFKELDTATWRILEDTFPTNLAYFNKNNLKLTNGSGLQLILKNQEHNQKRYTAASIASIESFQYSRIDAVIKPAKSKGIITACFLHRNDPWQEIDIEFLGKDTTKVLLNVYFNPGNSGTNCNYGNRGTPVVIELGFDAALDFHLYSIEWEPQEIRWYIDSKLVHVRTNWEPTPIPNLPMNLFVNIWPSNSEELADEIEDNTFPASSYFRSIVVSKWNINSNETILSENSFTIEKSHR